nr:MAG TPA: hypothetical protein [Caudoviricetes sp.]
MIQSIYSTYLLPNRQGFMQCRIRLLCSSYTAYSSYKSHGSLDKFL